MSYLKYEFIVKPPEPWTEILIAELSELPFESFEESSSGFVAYVQKDQLSALDIDRYLSAVPSDFIVEYSATPIKDENWNEIWENSFEPVVIDDRCCIRAVFHELGTAYLYDIVIQPKMSFGTGHHETTRLMLEKMLDMDFDQKHVVDAGCGTGVLSILAEKLGAKSVVAYDLDSWAVDNAKENIELNNCNSISVEEGNVALLQGKLFNTILANINKNVLKADLGNYARSLVNGGDLLLSGFFVSDAKEIQEVGKLHKLELVEMRKNNDWCLIHLSKGEGS